MKVYMGVIRPTQSESESRGRRKLVVRCFELRQTLMLHLFIWKLLFLTLKSSKQNFILSIYFQTVTYPLESSSANISTSTLDRRGSQNVGKSFNNSVFWITMVLVVR